MTPNSWPARAAILSALLTSAAAARADEPLLPSIPSIEIPLAIDSGPLTASASPEQFELVYTTHITVPGGQWLRLSFGACTLAGDPGADGSFIRITSMLDGAQQLLNAESLRWWSNTSAYFNGHDVLVEVFSRAGAGTSRLTISAATAGAPAAFTERSICGFTDDRSLTAIHGNGRLLSIGCTAWIFDDANHQFLTAGHCTLADNSVVEFNVPLSTAAGDLQHPPPQDQFAIDTTSGQGQSTGVGGGVGNDWAYFGTLPNSNTGITAFQHEGQFYTLAPQAPPVEGQTVRVTGFGSVSAPISLTYMLVQKTGIGPYSLLSGTTVKYTADTTGGDSGSPVIDQTTGLAIGIHTHAGCSTTTGANQGTAIQHSLLQAALRSPRGVCASGLAPADGSIMVASDLNNNLGTVNTQTAAFGRIGLVPRTFQGMATNHPARIVYAADNARHLWTITAAGAMSDLGLISGTPLTITGLGYDPATSSLYGIAGATGQLYRINTTSLAATTIGPAVPGTNIGGLEFDPSRNTLFGLDDTATGTRLVSINTTTGAQTLIGPLGTGTDCNGLAVDPATSLLYTIDAPTGRLLSINPATGTATPIGPTNALFGAAFGMAARPLPPCTADFNNDGDTATDADIEAFFACLADNCCPTCNSADFNSDGDTGTDADIEAFFRVLAGGAC